MSGKPNKMPNNISKKEAWLQTKEILGEYFQMQLFIAGLHDNLCRELMKANKDTSPEVYEAALNLEVI